jgi:hypothetical protein
MPHIKIPMMSGINDMAPLAPQVMAYDTPLTAGRRRVQVRSSYVKIAKRGLMALH